MQIKALVITGFGINCEEEMAAAYKLSGADASIVHLNEILLGRLKIKNYQVVNFPGGFSFGDDLGSGKVLANKIKYKKIIDSDKTLLSVLVEYLKQGNFIFGICNGFQALVKMGLLPNTLNKIESEVTLTTNNSGKFENRWVRCKVLSQNPTPFLKDIDEISLPVRHGEGKLLIKNKEIEKIIIENKLNCISYCNADGKLSSIYPENPNGSDLNIAGLCDKTGQVFGMMPHPEAYLSLYNNPNWGQMKRQDSEISEEGEGLKVFKNIVEYLR